MFEGFGGWTSSDRADSPSLISTQGPAKSIPEGSGAQVARELGEASQPDPILLSNLGRMSRLRYCDWTATPICQPRMTQFFSVHLTSSTSDTCVRAAHRPRVSKINPVLQCKNQADDVGWGHRHEIWRTDFCAPIRHRWLLHEISLSSSLFIDNVS